MNDFYKDLETGKEAERLFAEIATVKLGATQVKFNTSNKKEVLREWDIKYTNTEGKEVTFEIKNDLLSTSTGNFAVEFWGTNHASGIDATTANYWVILSGAKFYIFKTKDLKQLISANRFRSLQINNGTAYCYLVPIETAKTVATKIIYLS